MYGRLENSMVLDSYWPKIPEAAEEKLNSPGYREVGAGIFVPDEEAFNYALEHCFEVVPKFVHRIKWTQEFKEMLVEWFYSGGEWIRED